MIKIVKHSLFLRKRDILEYLVALPILIHILPQQMRVLK